MGHPKEIHRRAPKKAPPLRDGAGYTGGAVSIDVRTVMRHTDFSADSEPQNGSRRKWRQGESQSPGPNAGIGRLTSRMVARYARR